MRLYLIQRHDTMYQHHDHIPSQTQFACIFPVQLFQSSHSVGFGGGIDDGSASGGGVDRIEVDAYFRISGTRSLQMCVDGWGKRKGERGKGKEATHEDISLYILFNRPPPNLRSTHKIVFNPASRRDEMVASPPGPAPITMA